MLIDLFSFHSLKNYLNYIELEIKLVIFVQKISNYLGVLLRSYVKSICNQKRYYGII